MRNGKIWQRHCYIATLALIENKLQNYTIRETCSGPQMFLLTLRNSVFSRCIDVMFWRSVSSVNFALLKMPSQMLHVPGIQCIFMYIVQSVFLSLASMFLAKLFGLSSGLTSNLDEHGNGFSAAFSDWDRSKHCPSTLLTIPISKSFHMAISAFLSKWCYISG